jgi:hypothetical protein
LPPQIPLRFFLDPPAGVRLTVVSAPGCAFRLEASLDFVAMGGQATRTFAPLLPGASLAVALLVLRTTVGPRPRAQRTLPPAYPSAGGVLCSYLSSPRAVAFLLLALPLLTVVRFRANFEQSARAQKKKETLCVGVRVCVLRESV